MTSWLKKIFGYRTQKAPSGSLSTSEAFGVASGVAAGMTVLGVPAEVTAVSNTNSMLPSFDANAVVVLEKCSFADLREGDVVTYHGSGANSGKRVIHRLNERLKGGWWPLGDGNGRLDPELVTEKNFDRRLCAIIYAKKDAFTDR